MWRRPDPTAANGSLREFRPRISCFHYWERNIYGDDNGVVHIFPGERCAICGATCVRHTDGKIVEYNAPGEFAL